MRHKTNKSTLLKKIIGSRLFLPTLLIIQPVILTVANAATNDENSVLVAPNSEAKQVLMDKLAQLSFFSADFKQQILNEQGELLQAGAGNLAISKPNLVNWNTTAPDETLIVSDGNTLWFYDPFIEQASAYSLAKSIHNTPILLLTSDEPQLWQQYLVTQEQDKSFVITPIDENSQIKRLTLSFNHGVDEKTSHLTEFSFQDATGQISKISLSRFNSTNKPNASLFTFTLPEGVRLEDKR